MSRFFTPKYGINEDPVTGSSHTILGPFWSQILQKNHLNAFQSSKRGGEIWLEILENNRIKIKGHALTVLKGSIIS